MNTSDILKLIDAGYTKADIEAMENQKAPEETPDIKEEPKEEELKKDKPEEKKEEQKQDDFKEALKMMTDEMKAMRSDFQKHMINSDDMQITNPLAESEKILASIIDPPQKKRKEK